MATNNFFQCAEQNIHALMEDRTFDEWEWLKEDIIEDFKEMFNGYASTDANRYINFIARADGGSTYGKDIHGYFFVRLHLTSGYYEGANIGYDILSSPEEYSLWKHGLDAVVGDIVEDIFNYPPSNWNNGLLKCHKERITERVRTDIEKMIERLETFCEQWSDTEMRKIGTFSNGGAVYEKIG